MNKHENTQQFTGKYESEGSIGNILVSNFFSNLISLIPHHIHTALEVGCGAGYSTQRLDYALPHITWHGSDVSQTLTDMARTRTPHISFNTESIYKLTHTSNMFDLVLALEVFEHLDNPYQALEEIHRVTKQYAILSVPREPLWRILNMSRLKYLNTFGNTPGHINHWSSKAFKRFVSHKFIVHAHKTPIPWTILLLEKK